jgi:iron complex transport system substrate-binding protein
VALILSIAQPLTVELLAACAQDIKSKATAKLYEAHRIVSLAPSNTELLFSLGAQERLIGVSTTCNYPPPAGKLEKVGSFTSINFERLARMKPDTALFVTGQGALASRLKDKQVQIVILPNDNLSKIAGNLRTLGELTGRTAQANTLAQSCERSLSELSKLISSVKHRPRVFYCIWTEPLLTVGNNSFINGIITSTGGKNTTDNLDAAYPRYSMERLLLTQPEVVILPSNAQKRLALSKPPWCSLQAIRNKHFYILPETVEDRLSRPTLGIFEGLYWLSLRLHPELKPKLDTWIEKWRTTVRPQA